MASIEADPTLPVASGRCARGDGAQRVRQHRGPDAAAITLHTVLGLADGYATLSERRDGALELIVRPGAA